MRNVVTVSSGALPTVTHGGNRGALVGLPAAKPKRQIGKLYDTSLPDRRIERQIANTQAIWSKRGYAGPDSDSNSAANVCGAVIQIGEIVDCPQDSPLRLRQRRGWAPNRVPSTTSSVSAPLVTATNGLRAARHCIMSVRRCGRVRMTAPSSARVATPVTSQSARGNVGTVRWQEQADSGEENKS